MNKKNNDNIRVADLVATWRAGQMPDSELLHQLSVTLDEPIQLDKGVRVTFESKSVTCVIEISGTEKVLTLTDSAGGKHVVTGARGKAIASKVTDLALACAMEATVDRV